MTRQNKSSARHVAAELSFEQRVAELASFAHRHDRYPSTSTDDADESRLAAWLSKRRWEAKTGRLTDARTAVLDAAAPGWRQTVFSDEGFAATLATCARWVADHAALPRAVGGDEVESHLGLWLTARRYDLSVGRLADARAEALERLLDGWTATRGSSERFMRRCVSCARWIDEHGQLPQAGVVAADERVLGVWLQQQLRAAKEGRLAPAQREQLNSFLPGWDRGGNAHDRAFADGLLGCIVFVWAHGRFPRRTGADPRELVLGTWLANRRRDLAAGKLASARRQSLDLTLPGWHAGAMATQLASQSRARR